MKLIATIKPRADGTVVLDGAGKSHTFTPNERGELVGDIDNKAVLKMALESGNFYPASDADEQEAELLLSGDSASDADDDDADDDDLVSQDAPPVEGVGAQAPVEATGAAKPTRGRAAAKK